MTRRAGILAVVALVLAITGCAPDPGGAEPQIDVTGEFGRRPQIVFQAPIDISEAHTTPLITGEGKQLADGDPVLLAYVALSGVTGEVLDDSYAREPRSLTLTAEAGPLYEELIGVSEGTRLLHLSPGTVSRPEPVVMVYDVLHTAWDRDGRAIEICIHVMPTSQWVLHYEWPAS